MDEKTKLSYAENAGRFSRDWLNQPPPQDMYELLGKFFVPGGATADIGCGNGRDTNWLATNGFRSVGFDYSADLIGIAAKLFPALEFQLARLPSLSEINRQFDNVLCETVIMHLPTEQIPPALQSLKRITRQDGVVYLSWRVTEGADVRSPDGRLYSAFEPEFILKHFRPERVLHFEDRLSESSGKRVCRLLYRNE